MELVWNVIHSPVALKVKLSHERHAGAKGESQHSCYSFLTSALDRGEWSASRPGRAFPPGNPPPPGTHWIGGWVGLTAGLDTEAPCYSLSPDILNILFSDTLNLCCSHKCYITFRNCIWPKTTGIMFRYSCVFRQHRTIKGPEMRYRRCPNVICF
jgi:hypothetical protein